MFGAVLNRGTKLWFAFAAMVAVIAPVQAQTTTIVFEGTRANLNLLNPPGVGRCAPLNTINIAPGALSSTGTSNFGNFASTQSHCIPGPPSAANPIQPVTNGIFSYAFDLGDTLFGTYTGTATFANGVITGVENFDVTGGTGRFANADGTFTTRGTLGFVPNPTGAPGFVGSFQGILTGTLLLPAVPEPSTWLMLIVGFGFVGGSLRRRSTDLRRLPLLVCRTT